MYIGCGKAGAAMIGSSGSAANHAAPPGMRMTDPIRAATVVAGGRPGSTGAASGGSAGAACTAAPTPPAATRNRAAAGVSPATALMPGAAGPVGAPVAGAGAGAAVAWIVPFPPRPDGGMVTVNVVAGGAAWVGAAASPHTRNATP